MHETDISSLKDIVSVSSLVNPLKGGLVLSKGEMMQIRSFKKLGESTSKIELLDNQKENVLRHLEILKTNPFSVDLSVMGTGKTFMSLWVASKFNPKFLLVVCTASVVTKWIEVIEEYMSNLSYIVLSYESLSRGSSHNLFYEEFEPSQVFTNAVENGLIMIIDEFAKVKNKETLNFRALCSLVSYVCRKNYDRSKVIFLSGLPYDKNRQKEGFLELVGYDDTIEIARKIDPVKTKRLIKSQDRIRISMKKLYARIVDDIIFEHFATSAKPFVDKSSLDIKNGLYWISPVRNMELNASVSKLESLSRGDTHITKVLIEIEYHKAEIFARKAMEELKARNCKVIIMISFRRTLNTLLCLLSKFNPLVIEGNMNKEERKEVMKKFQKDDDEYRLLICTLTSSSHGIDLDDKTGNFPRKLFISPCFRAMNIHQAVYRIFRSDTASVATVRLVFAKDKVEYKILENLSKKNKNARSSLKKQLEKTSNLYFPGDYSDEVESDKEEYESIDYPLSLDSVPDSESESLDLW